MLGAYADLTEATILGLAVKELAGNLPDIDTLVLAPDLITSLLSKLTTDLEPSGSTSTTMSVIETSEDR